MPRPRTASPTQATVARAAGVSVPTVSKALRGDPSISERTRLLVHETAARVGYAPPGPAGGASREVSRAQVHVVFDIVDNAYTSQVLAGMLASAREVGSALQVEHLGTPADHLGDEGTVLTEQLVEDVCGRGDALILVTTPVSDRIVRCCEERLVPLLVIDPASDIIFFYFKTKTRG